MIVCFCWVLLHINANRQWVAVASAGPYAPRSRHVTTPASHNSSFLQAACPSCYPTNSVTALMANSCTRTLQIIKKAMANNANNKLSSLQTSRPIISLNFGHMSASFLRQIELCSIWCKIHVQESKTHSQASCTVDLYKFLVQDFWLCVTSISEFLWFISNTMPLSCSQFG